MPELSEEQIALIIQYATRAIGALALLFLTWVVSGWVARIIRKSCEKAKVDLTLGKFFAKAGKWAILAMGIIAILGMFGVNTASFAAVIAAMGLAVGLALQGTLGNFAAGVMLLIFRPFKVGDVVSVAGHTGKIDEIAIFSTTMDTPDNRRLILPNGAIFGSSIEVITHHDRRRVDVAVGVDYTADLDQTRSILTKVATDVEGRLSDEDPIIVLAELGASSVDWSVRVWAPTPDFFAVKEKLTEAVKKALDEANIGIPFPQMDVHIDGAVAQAG